MVTILLGLAVLNIINGTAKLPGAVFGMVLIGFLDAWLLLNALLLIQPRLILYNDLLRRGYFPIRRSKIAFKDIGKMLNIRDGHSESYFGFIMKDGYRFIIPTGILDENFTKEFLKRLALAGIKPVESINMDNIERFLYPKAYEIQDLEDKLLKQARERKSG